jgi:hypothetical protein
MTRKPEPVVLELAMLPREQAGPFLLLGLDKAVARDEIDAHWADRVKWARKQQVKVPLEDVNWAREVLTDTERRLQADASSINVDTCECLLGQLSHRYGVQGGQVARLWQPLDSEKSLADYIPQTEIPDSEAVWSAVVLPDLGAELPAVPLLLERLVQQPLDPWSVDLPGGDPRAFRPSLQDQAP